MKTEMIIQDYYGAKHLLEAHSDKDLTVFVVDDNKVYLKLLRDMLRGDHITVLTFETGEEALKVLDLEPDVVILDYHLDGVDHHAMRGDLVAKEIEKRLPNTEIILISSDDKFKFLTDLRNKTGQNAVYKNKLAPTILQDRVKSSWQQKFLKLETQRVIWNVVLIICALLFTIFLVWHILKIREFPELSIFFP